MTVGFVAPLVADALPRVRIPVVVVELALGIIVGRQVLGLATVDPQIEWLSQLGLAFLFFVAGLELDVERIRGRPLNIFVLVGLVYVASLFGLDFLFGAFAAGLVVGQTVSNVEPGHPLLEALQLKHEGIGSDC